MASRKANWKLFFFILIVLLLVIPFYYSLTERDYSSSARIGYSLLYLILSFGLGYLYGLIRWNSKKEKESLEKDNYIYKEGLQYCKWLFCATMGIMIIIVATKLPLYYCIPIGIACGFAILFFLWLGLSSSRSYSSSTADEYSYQNVSNTREYVCESCGKVHGLTPSVINKWHKCSACGAIFCDNCGKDLPGKRGFLEGERDCSYCSGRTILF